MILLGFELPFLFVENTARLQFSTGHVSLLPLNHETKTQVLIRPSVHWNQDSFGCACVCLQMISKTIQDSSFDEILWLN